MVDAVAGGGRPFLEGTQGNFPGPSSSESHMKRNFWICLLVFSLALNLGGLAAFGYLRLQGHGTL